MVKILLHRLVGLPTLAIVILQEIIYSAIHFPTVPVNLPGERPCILTGQYVH